MKTIEVVFEQASDGFCSAYMKDADELDYGVIGVGCSVGEAIKDFKIAYLAIKDEYLKRGKIFAEVSFNFIY